MNTATIVQKLWNYCNVLHDDGMSYGDHVEQLTYLLFLKMADDRIMVPYNQPSPVLPAATSCVGGTGFGFPIAIIMTPVLS